MRRLSMTFLDAYFPVENPVAIFWIVLLIILVSPLLFRRLHIPNMVGMILAGLVLGPYALNVLPFDRSIDVFGKVGLYYIMFLAGMEIDMTDFRKNLSKSMVFGAITFTLPFVLGLVSGRYLLHYSLASSLLLSAMFSSHTLVSMPIVSRYGQMKSRPANMAVGGTVVTVTLSMFLLAAVSRHFESAGGGSAMVWMLVKLLLALAVIFVLIPWASRWFLKYTKEGVPRFVFILSMAFFGSLLTEAAGFQGILGAFLTGLAINTQVPKLSSLMNRIQFVGNALFFPYFLIGIGMMINLRAFFQSWEGLYVAFVMIAVVLVGKYSAAKLTQRIYSMPSYEGNLLFGLTGGRAAVTLAVVMVGHEIILGQTPDGLPIRLLNDYVLNGSVVMIMVCCMVSPIFTEQAAKKMVLEANRHSSHEASKDSILIPISNPRIIEHQVQMAIFLRDAGEEVYSLSVVEENTGNDRKQSINLLNLSAQFAAAADMEFHQVMRFDSDVATGIGHAVREYNVSDILIGMHRRQVDDAPFSQKVARVLRSVWCNVYLTRFNNPPGSWRKLVVFVPENAEYEIGFFSFMKRLYRLSGNTSRPLVIYAHPSTLEHIQLLMGRFELSQPVELSPLHNWDNLPLLADSFTDDDMLVFALSRKSGISYREGFETFPQTMCSLFPNRSLTFFYPREIPEQLGPSAINDENDEI